MTRGIIVWHPLAVLIGVVGCGNGAEKPEQAPRGELICQTTVEDCIGLFTGTYTGTYSGDATGTWAVFIAEDGSVEGTATDKAGAVITLTGNVDETGTVTVQASNSVAFNGAIDFDQNVSGIWSGMAGKGKFTGSFVSRDNTLDSVAPSDTGAGGASSGEPAGSGGAAVGASGSYCERAERKAVECALETTDTCMEPVGEAEQCLFECVLALSCAAIQDSDYLACDTSCAASTGARNYCGEYRLKVVECEVDSFLFANDLCLTGATPANECRWACILDARCEQHADDVALMNACDEQCAMP